MNLLFFLAAVFFSLHHQVGCVDTVSVMEGTDGVSVMEGDSVTLHTGVQTNQQDNIRWYFKNTQIARITGDLSKTCTDVQCKDGDERFRDRLKLDHQTGSLTITNIRNTDSGEYKLVLLNNRSNSINILNVTVTEQDSTREESLKDGESVPLDPGEITSTNNTTVSGSGRSPGADAAIVVGVLFAVAVVTAMIYYCNRRTRKKGKKMNKRDQENHRDNSSPSPHPPILINIPNGTSANLTDPLKANAANYFDNRLI